jgi:hypothetical protein
LISQQGVVDEFVQALIQEGNIESILKMVELGYDTAIPNSKILWAETSSLRVK